MSVSSESTALGVQNALFPFYIQGYLQVLHLDSVALRDVLQKVSVSSESTALSVQNALFPFNIQGYLQVLNVITLYMTFIPRQNWF